MVRPARPEFYAVTPAAIAELTVDADREEAARVGCKFTHSLTVSLVGTGAMHGERHHDE